MWWKLFQLAVIGGGLTATPAQADYYRYFEWQRLPYEAKAFYISGAYDAYLAMSSGYPKSAEHYNKCAQQFDITNGQLTNGVEDLARNSPEMQSGTVTGIMIAYLARVCGLPPR